MNIEKTYFGTTNDGEKVYKFTLKNNKESSVEIINFGATIVSFKVKDKANNKKDIVLGYDSLEEYERGDKYFGATIGRNANRIKDSSFKLNNILYKLDENEGGNQLHGGSIGFQKRVWNYKITDKSLVVSYLSKDKEEGYPGNCELRVEFLLNDENELHIRYKGKTDKDTILNPTNHSYFNLNGEGKGTVLNHSIQINAKDYLPIDKNSIPLGEKRSVENTIFDLNNPKKISKIIYKDTQQIKNFHGLDHNFCLNKNSKKPILACTIENEDKSLKLLAYTDLPGIHVYTGNFIGKEKGKGGNVYENYSGVCLETQYYPNSINIESFESPILRSKGEFKSTTIYKII